MATFKAEVYGHQKRSDGTYNIKIRVTHNQKKKYLSTIWYVEKDDLTRSLKIKNKKYIDLTDDLIRKYRNRCDEVGEALKAMSVEDVVDLITRDDSANFTLDIVKYTRDYVSFLQNNGHAGTASVYKTMINSLIKYVGREEISYREITARFVNDWILWLGENACHDKTDRSKCRSQSLYPTQLKAIYNRAKKEFNDEDLGIIKIPYSPFTKVDIPKTPMVNKRALSIEQLKTLANLDYVVRYEAGFTNRFNFAKDVFLLSFGLIGMNAIDMYTCTDYKDGRITYQRTKTRNRRDDRAEISVRVEPEFQALFDKYRDPTGERVFNFYKLHETVNTFDVSVNVGLKKIGALIDCPKLNLYAARHTWATIAANDAGVDKYTVHTALNHSDSSMKITDIYIKKSWKPLDEANRKVLDLLQLNLGKVDEITYVSARMKKECDEMLDLKK